MYSLASTGSVFRIKAPLFHALQLFSGSPLQQRLLPNYPVLLARRHVLFAGVCLSQRMFLTTWHFLPATHVFIIFANGLTVVCLNSLSQETAVCLSI